MINTLNDYYQNSVPEVLETSAGLREKVNSEGSLLPFPGNTVVFLLDGDTKDAIRSIQDFLQEHCGSLLAQRLDPDTFHMTLHDLANGPVLHQRGEMAAQAKTILDMIRATPAAPIPMTATWSFNMVNTSIVLGLEPATKDAWNRLDDLYMQFQQVRNLPYALTPHITLAYFRPGCYGPEQTARLRAALGPIDLTMELQLSELVLQEFADMNHYTTIY